MNFKLEWLDMMRSVIKLLGLLLLNMSLVMVALANRYQLNTDDSLVGQVAYTQADDEDTLLDIARRHGFGYQDLKLANPDVDTWLPSKDQKQIILPAQFILPVAARKGIVLNIPEMRLYYYPAKQQGVTAEVITYPLGIGREGWGTPYIKTKIVEKKVAPNWYPPESIRKEHEEAGDPLPKIVLAGPDNPLGEYAMRLGQRDYLIHGTNRPYGVGMRVSHGCIRLYPENIKALFAQVPLKTPVNIINQPYKVGVQNDVIYLEAHPFLEEDLEQYGNNMTSIVEFIIQMANERDYEVDWDAIYDEINVPSGLPIAIGVYIPKPSHKKSPDE